MSEAHCCTSCPVCLVRDSPLQEFANPQPMIAGDVLRSDLRFLRLQIALGRSFAVQCIKEFAWLFTVQIVLFYIVRGMLPLFADASA